MHFYIDEPCFHGRIFMMRLRSQKHFLIIIMVCVLKYINQICGIETLFMGRWRNGSAFDSRSKGYLFKSGVAQFAKPQNFLLLYLI